MLNCGSASCTESASRDHLLSRFQDLQQQVGKAQKLLRNGKLGEAGPFLFLHSEMTQGYSVMIEKLHLIIPMPATRWLCRPRRPKPYQFNLCGPGKRARGFKLQFSYASEG